MTPLRYLLDTNICIYIAKQRPPSVAEQFDRLAAGAVGMSLVTFGELHYGAGKSSQRASALEILARLQELIPVIAMDNRVGESYGVLRARLERSGTPIGNNDLWIAAHALALDLTLVTNNTREFARVPGLRLANWIE
ncbi:MAG: type II toxin-antitoxin system tRNA(fMet)-specific endonuclease VapC [Rhodocyclaceae bacterium]